MSFEKTMHKVGENLEKTFEKNATKGVNDPDDGSQADHDARQAGGDTANSASDEGNEQVKNHEPAWKAVKDVADDAIGVEKKAAETTKIGFFKFVGVVTAIFTAVMTYSYIHPDEHAVESRKMLKVVDREREEQRRIQELSNIVVSQEEFNSMVGGLFVQSAPAPQVSTAPVAAAALPPPVAAIAAEPAQVQLTTETGSTDDVTTTVGEVYTNSPVSVRREMERPPSPPPPSRITHGYDGTEDNSGDCFHTHCLSPHKSFTVDSGFAKVSVSY